MLLCRDRVIGANFQKIKVKQALKIIKFSKTSIRNYWGKPKNRTWKDLIQKKITDSRTFWKTVVRLSTNKASRGEKIILNEAQKHISDDKKVCTIFKNFFQTLSQTQKCLIIVNIFHKRTHSFSTIIETLEKHPSILNIKKETWFSIFVQKDCSKRGIKNYPGFKH